MADLRRFYLDVDGVLLGKRDPSSSEVVLARGAGDLLEFGLQHLDCYWLTTHCRGDSATVLRYLDPFSDPLLKILLPAVKATSWRTLKTEALTGDCLWLQDAPLATERAWLAERGGSDRWIEVDTRSRPDDPVRSLDRVGSSL